MHSPKFVRVFVLRSILLQVNTDHVRRRRKETNAIASIPLKQPEEK